jgi:hypothetical protein
MAHSRLADGGVIDEQCDGEAITQLLKLPVLSLTRGPEPKLRVDPEVGDLMRQRESAASPADGFLWPTVHHDLMRAAIPDEARLGAWGISHHHAHRQLQFAEKFPKIETSGPTVAEHFHFVGESSANAFQRESHY